MSTAQTFAHPGARAFVRARAERIVVYSVICLAMLATLWWGHAELAFTPGVPERTDLGGHIVALKYLIEVSLPHGHLLDWSHQWFAGYPSFYFYPPLPALLIAALTAILPLAVAAKLVAVAAPALLPPAAYLLVRALGFTRTQAACAVFGALIFLTTTSQYIFGGNILSSVIGEYSYQLGFAFALVYLSRVAAAVQGRRTTVWLAITLAMTALSHPIAAIFAVVGSCSALTEQRARRQVLSSWLIGFCLAAFWALPFLVRSRYMGAIVWSRAHHLNDLFPLAVLMVLPWTLSALVLLRRDQRVAMLAWLAAFALLGYLLPHGLFAAGRTLPLWYFVLFLVTALGVVIGVQHAWRRESRVALTFHGAGIVLMAGLLVLQTPLVRSRARKLLSNQAPDTHAFDSLRAAIAQLPSGRVHWEYQRADEQLLGARMPLARLPAALPHIRTSQGLLLESALTSPAYWHLLANISADSFGYAYSVLPARNVRDSLAIGARLRQLGIDYFVSFSAPVTSWATRQSRSFQKVASASQWTIWRVPGVTLAQPLVRPPVVVPPSSWQSSLRAWLESVTDTTSWRVIGDPARMHLGSMRAIPESQPARTRLGYRSIDISTAAVGVPHIVRVAFFPNWRAYGADGPYLAVPGFMIIVPRQQHVQLRFERTSLELLSALLSAGTLLCVCALAIGRKRTRRQ